MKRASRDTADRISFAIVGAGPYGLALAHVLAGEGVRPLVLGAPMDTWTRRMPRGMFLKSEGRASSIIASDERLTLASYCAEVGADYADIGTPVPLETFVSYGRWFQERTAPEVETVEVEEIRPGPGCFELILQGGDRVRARQVAVAVGVRPFAYEPAELRTLPARLRSHTIEHRDLAQFAGKRVVIVGCGQSALESAALIHEAGGEATVVCRAARIAWNPPPAPESHSRYGRLRHPYTPLGPGWPLWPYANLARAYPVLPERVRRRKAREILGPAGAWWLRERVESHVSLLPGRQIVRCDARDDAVCIVLQGPDGTEELDADHVLAATGYRVDVTRLPLLAPALRERITSEHGAPALSSRLESSVPGLFFTGIAAMNHFGPLMRFVCGAEFAARRLAPAAAVEPPAGRVRRRYAVDTTKETA